MSNAVVKSPGSTNGTVNCAVSGAGTPAVVTAARGATGPAAAPDMASSRAARSPGAAWTANEDETQITRTGSIFRNIFEPLPSSDGSSADPSRVFVRFQVPGGSTRAILPVRLSDFDSRESVRPL